MTAPTHTRVMAFLGILRGAHPDMIYIYTHGSCYRLHRLLRLVFPGAVPFHSLDHVVTLIDGRFYDITGEILGARDRYWPMDEAAHRRHRHCRAGGVIHHPPRDGAGAAGVSEAAAGRLAEPESGKDIRP